MKSIETVKLAIAILGITVWSACSDSAKLNNNGDQTTSDNVFVSQTPTGFEVDPFWPEPLPNNWILGEISGVAVDAYDHVWIVQRPNSLSERETGAAQDPRISECCNPAPSVIEFDPDGNVLQAWGNQNTNQPWISTEHGIFVDDEGNVWIAGNSGRDQVVLKLSNKGKLLLQIGEWGVTKGSNDTKHLGGPTDIAVDAGAKEVYIADGYGNRRIIVFDSETGEYKRHWGAYGEVPDDSELPAYNPDDEPLKSFRNPVHGVRISSDNLVYIADRSNNRIQVFMKDGTFVREAFIARQTLDAGSVWDIEFSPDPDQTYMYVADGRNMKVWILNRATLEVVGSFGQGGRMAGQFGWVHNVAMDSKGNLYASEVSPGQRVQKFRPIANQQ
ncbi:hypothetical protein ACFLU5_14450 [Bacteroidota bacterium]